MFFCLQVHFLCFSQYKSLNFFVFLSLPRASRFPRVPTIAFGVLTTFSNVARCYLGLWAPREASCFYDRASQKSTIKPFSSSFADPRIPVGPTRFSSPFFFFIYDLLLCLSTLSSSVPSSFSFKKTKNQN